MLASLHTRDVTATVTALRDLHIDNSSLAGNLTGIISQRLIRRLCEECCEVVAVVPGDIDEFVANDLAVPKSLRSAVGCPRCQGTGYYERIGIYEVVVPDDSIDSAIAEGAAEDELRRVLRSRGHCSLRMDTLEKVRSELTSMEEYCTLSTLQF